MRNYEMLMIISPEITDEELPNAIDKVTQQITTRGGNVTETNNWGKRKLAYPIKHFKEGNYILTYLEADPGILPEFEANLRISEDILRHLIIRLDD